jgi:adenosylhomocysteine nucleosidase
MSGVLVAAATRWEAEPIRKALRGRRSAAVLRTGMGPSAASAALSRLETEPGLIVSAGFAGALQEDLRAGDLVAQQLTPCPSAAKALEKAAVGLGLVPRFGRILHADFVLATPEQKREAGARSGALAVDMESAAVAAWARQRGLPALALRVIFDERDRPLPRSSPSREDGLGLACWAALHPFSLPRLAALWPLQRRCAAVLSSVVKAFLEAL